MHWKGKPDMRHDTDRMFCKHFSCSMSVLTCRASQCLAIKAIQLTKENDQVAFFLDDVSLNRLAICGKCKESSINYREAKSAFHAVVAALAEKINHFDEYGFEPEITMMRRRKAGRIYRKKMTSVIQQRNQYKRDNQKIQQLENELA